MSHSLNDFITPEMERDIEKGQQINRCLKSEGIRREMWVVQEGEIEQSMLRLPSSFTHDKRVASQVMLIVKNPPANVRDVRGEGSIPG